MSPTGLLIALCVVIVAWLTAAATAVRSVSRVWLRRWAEQRLATPAGLGESALLARPQRLVTAAGAGTALLVAVAGALLGAGDGRSAWAVAGETIALVLVFLIVGQLVPRAIARRWAPGLLPVLVPPLDVAAFILAPALDAARAVGRSLTPGSHSALAPASEGVEDMLREGELEGIGEQSEIDIIAGLVEFGEKVVRDVMTPRTAVFAVDESTPPEEMARAIAQSGYSRVPVYRESMDHIIGMVHVFDVLETGGHRAPPIRQVAHAPLSTRLSSVLFEMLRAQRHLAVVLDEFGGTAGIVTLEDLLEELVGDIRDEHDEPAAADQLAGAERRPSVLDASTPLDEVERRTGLSLGSDGDRAQTLGGAIVRSLGRIPAIGERFHLGDYELTVVDAEPSRIRRVLVQRVESARVVDLKPTAPR
ncbi:MAG TPA: hemolysin family protein [Gemmatimonadaceae bacterium]|nr:hemolysin family protein [Gemmatimonadaceae bacterium]